MSLMPLAPERQQKTQPDGRPYTEDHPQFFELVQNGGVRMFQRQDYPTMVYHTVRDGASRVTTSHVCQDQAQHEAMRSRGWADSPDDAVAALEAREQADGQAAAERAAGDRRMSDAAQREARAATAEADGHLGAIPERKKRGRPRKVDPTG